MIEVNIYNFLPVVNYDNLYFIKEVLNGISIKRQRRKEILKRTDP